MCIPAPSTSGSNKTWAGQLIEEDISKEMTEREIEYLRPINISARKETQLCLEFSFVELNVVFLWFPIPSQL